MSGEIERFVLIRLSGTRMAIRLAEITEVTELPDTWQIPLAPPVYRGAMNAHGRIIPVLDLAAVTGAGVGNPEGKTVLLDRNLADLALWVDDVERVVPVPDVTLHGEAAGIITGLLDVGGMEIPLISADSLVEMLESDLQMRTPDSADGVKGTA